MWNEIRNECEEMTHIDQKDRVNWMLAVDGKFSVRCLYLKLVMNEPNFPHKFMWKVKIPPKIKVFLWLMSNNSVLTKDILLRRGWIGSEACPFCGKDEYVDHLFFTCSIAILI